MSRERQGGKRQRQAILKYARQAGYKIVDRDWFYDAAASRTDPIETPKGFQEMLERTGT